MLILMLLYLSGQYLSICAMTVSREAVSFYALRLTSQGLYLLIQHLPYLSGQSIHAKRLLNKICPFLQDAMMQCPKYKAAC